MHVARLAAWCMYQSLSSLVLLHCCAQQVDNVTEEEAIRGFRVIHHETMELVFDQPGSYMVPEAAAQPEPKPQVKAIEAGPAKPLLPAPEPQDATATEASHADSPAANAGISTMAPAPATGTDSAAVSDEPAGPLLHDESSATAKDDAHKPKSAVGVIDSLVHRHDGEGGDAGGGIEAVGGRSQDAAANDIVANLAAQAMENVISASSR